MVSFTWRGPKMLALLLISFIIFASVTAAIPVNPYMVFADVNGKRSLTSYVAVVRENDYDGGA